MKTRFYIILAAAAALLAGCAKEIAAPEAAPEAAPQGKITIPVGISPVTRTHLGPLEGTSHKVFWSNGDKIKVNGVESEALADLEGDVESTQFTFPADPALASGPYKAIYPASIYTDETHVTLPAVQTYKADGFGEGMNPMFGYGATVNDITVGHLCAIVKVSVLRASAPGSDEEDLVSVRFKGRNGEQVAGLFGIDYENGTLTGASNDVNDKVVKVSKTLATSTDEAAVYYVVVPAITYENGFDVLVQDASGHVMTQSKLTSKTLEAGHIYAMTEFEFVPTTTQLGIEISNANELVAFATAYNNRTYESYGSALVATLTDDISFDAETSAAFNATGGIGTPYGGTNYFDGTFSGEGFIISGLEATVPMFNAIAESGVVKNFLVNNDCIFTFTHPNTADGMFGPVAGYSEGLIENVQVLADVSLAAGSVTNTTALGGLVGNLDAGTVDGCCFSGNLAVSPDFQATDHKIFIGGIAGEITDDGIVIGSEFSGTIDNQGKMIATEGSTTGEPADEAMKSDPQLIIGGIAGLNSGMVDNCVTVNHPTGITVTLNDGSDHPYTGTIVTHSTIAYNYAMGGIVGRNDGTVTACENSADILNVFSAVRGNGGNMNGRYLHIGGIAGYNSYSAEVSGSTNRALIIDRSNPKVHYIGGVVGNNRGTISSSSNAATATIGVGTSHLSPYGARMPYIGGVAGYCGPNASLNTVSNAAAINVSRIENATGIMVRIGGVIGQSEAEIDGGTITNSGNVTQSSGIGKCSAPTATNDYGIAVGGVVGYASKSVKNVSNTGNVTYTCSNVGSESAEGGAHYVYLGGVAGKINASSTVDVERCTNSGNVQFTIGKSNNVYANFNSSAYVVYDNNYLGGILGHGMNVAIKGDASNMITNSGIVKGGDGSKNNNKAMSSFAIGGIVGYLAGASSIEYCDLTGTGQAYNDHWSNRGITNYDCPADGGIAGQVVGAEGALISIKNCKVSSTIHAEGYTDGNTAVYARRGAVGGIVGNAQYASISDCSVPVNFTTGSGYLYGGIAGKVQYSTVSNCTYTGVSIQSSQLQAGGGIVGILDTGSTLDGCISHAKTINKNGTAVTAVGGIAGSSNAGTTIKNCQYTVSIAICGDANFTDGGGNVQGGL